MRADMDPEPVLLPRGGAAFLAALLNGDDFGTALEAATTAVPDFDLTALLGLLLGHGAITAIGDPT